MYAPQSPFGDTTRVGVSAGDSVSFGVEGIHYAGQPSTCGKRMERTYPGKPVPRLRLTHTAEADSGEYVLTVTNPDSLLGLELTSEPFYVFVLNSRSDSLALAAIYNSTDGDNWTNNTNWLGGPVSSWEGVTVSGGRVTGLDLSANGLTGSLPAELGDLSALTSLDVSSNGLTGALPAGLGALSRLITLDVSSNGFSSLPRLAGLTSLEELYIDSLTLTFKDIAPNVNVASGTTCLCPAVPGWGYCPGRGTRSR